MPRTVGSHPWLRMVSTISTSGRRVPPQAPFIPRIASDEPRFLVREGWDLPVAHRACRDAPYGWLPSLAADGLDNLDQRSPSPPAGSVYSEDRKRRASIPREGRLGLAGRSSSLSRCPARLAPIPGCGWSRQSRPAVAESPRRLRLFRGSQATSLDSS